MPSSGTSSIISPSNRRPPLPDRSHRLPALVGPANLWLPAALVACQLPQSEDAMSEQPQMGGSEATNPGDQVPPDVPGAGEALCPRCSGSGRIDGTACENCGGSGKIVEGIGGAGARCSASVAVMEMRAVDRRAHP